MKIRIAALTALSIAIVIATASTALAESGARTFCNPLDLDYAFARKARPTEHYVSHRSTADPVCVRYKDKFYLFATNQEGYWHSTDLSSWHFVSHKFQYNDCGDQVCAPAAWPTDKGLLFLPCFVEKDKMPLYISTDPAGNHWSEAVESFRPATWDPAIFQDDEAGQGKLYIYWGSSNLYPLYGQELDVANGYKPIGKPVELLHLHPREHGWEQFGEDNQNGKMDPFIEGAWMNKYNGRYYLQYGAPGTEFNIYGDGVYVSDKPLGPFTYQKHNPFSWKPTGFIRGAGHGSTFDDGVGNLWHVATMDISVKDTFERRIGMFPAAVDRDGVLFSDTAFGDYPQYIPRGKIDYATRSKAGDYANFTGWMLLSYKKNMTADASLTKHPPELAADENVKTYWSAPDGKAGHWLSIDLGKVMTVRAWQINFADEQASLWGKQKEISQRYQVFASNDGQNWYQISDHRKAVEDHPHAYRQLEKPVKTRYLKLVNEAVPSGCFAIQDWRIFGHADAPKPETPAGLTAERDSEDARNVALRWRPVEGAYAYAIDFGTAADKLYSSLLVYDQKTANYNLHSLNIDSPYFFRVRAVGESGLSGLSDVVSVSVPSPGAKAP